MKLALFSSLLLATGIAAADTPVNGWYTNAFGGYTSWSSDIDFYHSRRYSADFSYTNGYNVGGRIGYKSNPIRYEFEYTYLSATIKGVKLSSGQHEYVKGNSSTNLAMANLYYDFPEILRAISPFAGVGIGYAFMSTSVDKDFPLLNSSFHTDRNAFAYQGTAGLTYNFSENYALNAAYRFTATSKGGDFNQSFHAHMGNFGIIYRFDTLNYK